MITVDAVSKSFGKLKALDNISITCRSGECIALTGPNGSGKTTLIKSILGMIVPDSGKILVNGEDVAGGWKYREGIGYMPQIGRYPDNMTIGQVLDMIKDMRQTPAARLDEELIRAFKIPSLLHKRMGTLSGGTRQKVSACLAFLFQPDVLILDEPTAGLDPVSTEILKEKIVRETDKGKLILITSHVLSDLEELVSEVIYMQDGKLCFHKQIERLLSDTKEERLGRAIAKVMSGI
ncbi:ABC transporter ATP-binding protein [Chitinophaga tropicalis]|uniref:ATP-binding cassette domain-containing protein n=1 Tax=Chitinophaga tropicalis TaxID=2683588 RepID=A0A7K1U5D0_9BACT|nr:ABC transporter ATP-binding protein [Chitinophaga tropicalis]MVT09567.1 ATP-binding cassette domain-containing protein [Chitinophaga tropicalis]